MEGLSELNTMLQLMPQPAFRVENGIISHVNQAAAAYFLEAGQSFAPLILSGQQEYAEFSAGTLYLTLSLAGMPTGAYISRFKNEDIVTLEQSAELQQLQSMALAAKTLRYPLEGLISIADQMLPAVATEGSELENQAAQMNQRLYQMMRIINNMSDAAGYVQMQTGRMETVEICAFLEEILEKVAVLTQTGGISLAYELPNKRIFTLVDSEKLERSVYNLLSNAMKFAAPDTTVRVKLTHKDKRLYFSVSNTHPGSGPQGNICNRFLREPALDGDHRSGIGLGMVLVRSTATLHGGTLLTDQTNDGTRITMTLQIRTAPSNQVRSPVLCFDYAGEHDHCLLELADILPQQHYSTENIL